MELSELSTIWFQKEQLPLTVRASIGVVRKILPERGERPWPACSADLYAFDYFFLGVPQRESVHTRPRITDDLKIAIRNQISAIPENMARRALGNVRASLQECESNDGQYLSDVLFKTK
jgi:hypothetical protein